MSVSRGGQRGPGRPNGKIRASLLWGNSGGSNIFPAFFLVANKVPKPCSMYCPGSTGVLPSLQCTTCSCLFHPKCQGVSLHVRSFKCRACAFNANQQQQQQRRRQMYMQPNHRSSSSSSGADGPVLLSNNMVRVKLPMPSKNGKRPIVELVMEQNGRYQPIKFSNNMQVTEIIPKSLFDRASANKKAVYQRAVQVPRVGSKQLYLAINPSTPKNPLVFSGNLQYGLAWIILILCNCFFFFLFRG